MPAQLQPSDLIAVDFVGPVRQAQQARSRVGGAEEIVVVRSGPPNAWIAQSITWQAISGAATLIIAISVLAALFPTVSIIQAALSVSKRACSIRILDLAIRSSVTVCSASGRPNGLRSSTRRHILSRIRSASPISRIQ